LSDNGGGSGDGGGGGGDDDDQSINLYSLMNSRYKRHYEQAGGRHNMPPLL